jgi:hypothetical protein
MAYLDNSVVTVDAVLTKKGRERLAQGRDAFKITKFAVADDEIDYTLYNTAHPLGSNYYSNIIESMPVLEAIPDESQVLRYKLVTLQNANGIRRIPQIKLGNNAAGISVIFGDSVDPIKPVTTMTDTSGNSQTFDTNLGYTLILFDEEAADVSVDQSDRLEASTQIVLPPDVASDPLVNFSSNTVAAGKIFQIAPKEVTSQKNTNITIFGNESGATITIPFVVYPPTTA